MVASGLGKIFQLNVGWIGKPPFRTILVDRRSEKILANDGNIIAVQSQITGQTYSLQAPVAIHWNGGDSRDVVKLDFGDHHAYADGWIPIEFRVNPPLLDNVIRQKLSGKGVSLNIRHIHGLKAVPFRCVDRLTRVKPYAKNIFNSLNCCAASIVFDTGPETHPDGPAEIKGEGGKSGNLCHRIGKYLGLNLDELILSPTQHLS
jgi:hypothetical protein